MTAASVSCGKIWRCPTKKYAGLMPSEICRRHGISEASFYNWKAK